MSVNSVGSQAEIYAAYGAQNTQSTSADSSVKEKETAAKTTQEEGVV